MERYYWTSRWKYHFIFGDIMSSLVSNVWLEIKRRSQKILICGVYWEFSNLVNKEQMSINEQLEK